MLSVSEAITRLGIPEVFALSFVVAVLLAHFVVDTIPGVMHFVIGTVMDMAAFTAPLLALVRGCCNTTPAGAGDGIRPGSSVRIGPS